MDYETLFTALVGVLAGGGVGAAVIGWLKDRKKDGAAVLLTNVEALQKQVLLLKDITDYLRKENAQLVVDRDTYDERNRTLRKRLNEVEGQLEETQRTALRALAQVDDLREKVRELAAGEDIHNDGNR